MNKIFARTSVWFAVATLFATGFLLQSKENTHPAAPTSLSILDEDTLASGPTIPPGPYDEDDDNPGDTKIASGPTIPPGPYDEDDDNPGDTKIASGPTIPPGPYDEDDDNPGDTKIA